MDEDTRKRIIEQLNQQGPRTSPEAENLRRLMEKRGIDEVRTRLEAAGATSSFESMLNYIADNPGSYDSLMETVEQHFAQNPKEREEFMARIMKEGGVRRRSWWDKFKSIFSKH